jgi:hypothetical protein
MEKETEKIGIGKLCRFVEGNKSRPTSRVLIFAGRNGLLEWI